MSSESLETVYGHLPSNLSRARLADLCVPNGVQTGPFGSQLHKEDYVDNGTPIITVEHLGDNRIIHKDLPKVSDIDTDRLEKYKLKKGDIVFSRVGSVDRRALVQGFEDGWLFSGRCLRVRPNPDLLDGQWLSYFFGLPSFKNYIRGIAVGATMPSLNTKLLSDVPIFFPEKPYQKQAAKVLGVLDDRITLLRETNATLEAIAQALFKSWFVDFDPVKAKQEGRSPEGMDEETAALFPDSFEESELGMIPRGWKVLSLDQIANYLNGLALQKFPPTGIDDLPVIKIAQLRKGDATGADLASRSLKPEYIIKDGDVLFSWSGTLMVSIWCGGEGALNQHLFKVSSDVFPKWFYYHWTLQHLSDFQMIAESKATTMGHIQRSHLSAAKVVVPNVEVITEAGALLEALLNRSVENQVQAKSLASIRDTLLPRLISGQLPLEDLAAKE